MMKHQIGRTLLIWCTFPNKDICFPEGWITSPLFIYVPRLTLCKYLFREPSEVTEAVTAQGATNSYVSAPSLSILFSPSSVVLGTAHGPSMLVVFLSMHVNNSIPSNLSIFGIHPTSHMQTHFRYNYYIPEQPSQSMQSLFPERILYHCRCIMCVPMGVRVVGSLGSSGVIRNDRQGN